MKKMFLDENNKIHKQLYFVIIFVLMFISALFISDNYLQADESKLRCTKAPITSSDSTSTPSISIASYI